MTLPPAYFERLYDGDSDPWGFESRWYEQRKYAVTVASLPRQTYRRGLEVGCSVGVLTSLLAERCSSLLAVDVADSAVEVARRRLAARPHVTVERRTLPGAWPSGNFDLVVLSEVGYYLAPDDLRALLCAATTALDPDGAIVAVHWRHEVADYPLRGDEVQAAVAASPGLQRLVRHEEADFLLEVFVTAPAVSVARATGIIE